MGCTTSRTSRSPFESDESNGAHHVKDTEDAPVHTTFPLENCEVESEDDFECVSRYRGPAKKHVLVVDDCEKRLLAVKRALESENDGGFRDLVVELARSGDECLEIISDVVSMRGRNMRTAPDVVLISQDLGGADVVGNVSREQQRVGAKKSGMSGVDCCAEIRRRHGELSCVGEQFLHVVLLTEDRPEYVFDREEYDKETLELSRSNFCCVDDNWSSASGYEKETWTVAYVNAMVTKTLPNNLLDADLLAAVKHMLSFLPVVIR